jgi:hypothetical protein
MRKRDCFLELGIRAREKARVDARTTFREVRLRLRISHPLIALI